jgi:uncharacterized protein (TIGR02118 family)
MTTTARLLVLWDTPEDPDRFERHYREIHVPLVKKLSGVRRYTFSRNTVIVRGEAPWYRIAELDFDDVAALRQAFASPEGRAVASDTESLLSITGAAVHSMIYELEDLA